MNTARLVAGWLFLMGLTAAGAYYATDEVNQRVDLSKYNIYEKLGVTKYALASVTPPRSTSTTGVVNPPVTVAPSTNQAAPIQAPVNAPQSVQPPPAPQQAYQQPPAPQQQPYQQPPATQQAYQQRPPNAQQAYQQPPAYQQQPRMNQPPGNQPPPRQSQPFPNSNQMPADYSQVRTRLTGLQGQAHGEEEYWQSIRASLASMHQPLRPEISAALSTLSRATAQAEQALRTGDTQTARQQMDLADKQLQILEKAKE